MKNKSPITKANWKVRLVFLLFLVAPTILFAQNVGINTSGSTPSQNAILDLNTGNAKSLGLLIPRVVLGASLSTFNPPIANAPTGLDSGMMVFNWQATNQSIGYYYWNGTTWVSVSGGGGAVTSVTGTSPVVVSPRTGATVVSLQGTAGTVCYGTVGGSNFTAAGTIPTATSGTAPAGSAQVLVSQGTSTPTWNAAGGVTQIIYDGLSQTGGLENWPGANTDFYGPLYLQVFTAAGESYYQLAMPKCVVTRIRIMVYACTLNSTSTFYVRQNATNTALFSIVPANAAQGAYTGSGNITFNDGQLLSVSGVLGGTGAEGIELTNIQITYYVLP